MDYCGIDDHPGSLPEGMDRMIRLAEILSEDFPHVRVDMYNIEGHVIFGEMTFFNASGYMRFFPDEFDYTMGGRFILPPKTEARGI